VPARSRRTDADDPFGGRRSADPHCRADYLQECGFKVLETSAATEATTILQATEIRIDVVFSDVRMQKPQTLLPDCAKSWTCFQSHMIFNSLSPASVRRLIPGISDACDAMRSTHPAGKQ